MSPSPQEDRPPTPDDARPVLRPPRSLGAVLWFPVSAYARAPFALLAATALPLVPGQLLGALLDLGGTEGARVVDGEVLAPPTPLGAGTSISLGNVELTSGWFADALTLVGWVIGLAVGALVAAGVLFDRRLDARAAVRSVARRLPGLALWSVLLLVFAAFALGSAGAGWIMLFSALTGDMAWSVTTLVWPLLGTLMLVLAAPLLLGPPIAVLYGLTLPEAIGAAWLLARGRRVAHLLCLLPLGALLLLPGTVEDRVTEALAGSGTGLALGTGLGLKVLLVLVLAPLPVLLLTGQALWAPRDGSAAASTLGGPAGPRLVADRLHRAGTLPGVPPRRPLAAAALAASLVLVALASGAALGANPHGAPGVTTERLSPEEFEALAEGRLPGGHDVPAPPAEVTRSDGRPLVGDRDDEVYLRDCRDTACSEWDTLPLGGGSVNSLHGPPGLTVDDRDRPRVAFVDGTSGMLTFLACADPSCAAWETTELLDPYDLPLRMSAEDPSGYAPVRVLPTDGDRPELLLGHHRIACADPLCGLTV
ncbi:hypothetical protein ABZ635_13705 [Nocardiopsis sp. NPDC007018]|uniref:hypothetical protein n=1 Tax=Nocardiopsis sp. NPDC007018 TaxID=3155721 RepID=UPI0033D9262D